MNERKKCSFKDYGNVLKKLDLLNDKVREFLTKKQTQMVTFPFSNVKVFGSIENGSLVDKSIELAEIAIHLNETYYNNEVDNKSLARVCILAQIAKTNLYQPATEEWENKRGIYWKYANQESTSGSRTGELSYIIARNLDLNITDDEYRGIISYDKALDDNNIHLHGTLMEKIIRQANDILMTRNRFNITTEIVNNYKLIEREDKSNGE